MPRWPRIPSSAFIAAIQAGYGSILNTLILAAGTAVKGKIGYRALCDGINFDVGLEYINILLKAGADPNYSILSNRDSGPFGSPLAPIQIAASVKNLPALSLLIKYGADINAFNLHFPVGVSNATALQFAALHRNLQMADLLLENGADINAPPADRNGRTTLEGAAEHGRLEIVRFLLTREPKLKISGPYRIHFLRAVKIANERGHREVAEFLKLHGG
ncbi:ankyrin repeat-containing domain protein, partial [Cladorrhinum samala]